MGRVDWIFFFVFIGILWWDVPRAPRRAPIQLDTASKADSNCSAFPLGFLPFPEPPFLCTSLPQQTFFFLGKMAAAEKSKLDMSLDEIREAEQAERRLHLPPPSVGSDHHQSPNGAELCYNCNRPGHRRRDCRLPGGGMSAGGGGPGPCHNCGRYGHLARECRAPVDHRRSSGYSEYDAPAGGMDVCYNCGGKGHRQRDCPSPFISGGGGPARGPGGPCYNCGKIGHRAAECRFSEFRPFRTRDCPVVLPSSLHIHLDISA